MGPFLGRPEVQILDPRGPTGRARDSKDPGGILRKIHALRADPRTPSTTGTEVANMPRGLGSGIRGQGFGHPDAGSPALQSNRRPVGRPAHWLICPQIHLWRFSDAET